MIFALGIVFGILTYRKRIHHWLIPLLLGASLLLLHSQAPWETYTKLLPREECSATVRARLGALRSSNDKYWTCEMQILELSTYNSSFVSCNGKVLAFFDNDIPYNYGATCTARGAFLNFENDFFQQFYLTSGIRRTFHANLVTDTQPPQDFFHKLLAKLFDLREFLTEKLTAHIDDPDAAAIYSAMIFGVRSNLSPEVKNAFVKSSTVHLFSISGLHIGLMSLCLGLVVRICCVPLRLRLPLICAVLLLYVLLSGGAPSALRAWLMILLIIVSQSCFRVHSSENTLGIAGLALLISNPYYLLHSGFLFSFTLVFVLVRSNKICRQLANIICEKRFWMPRRALRTIMLRKFGTVLCTIGASIAAWLGCNGIMMYFNGLVSYGSIIINTLIGPIAFLLVACAFPKIIASLCCEHLSLWLGQILSCILQFLLNSSSIAAQPGLYTTGAKAPLWYALLYCAMLIIFLSEIKPVHIRITAFLAMLSMAIAFPYLQQRTPFLVISPTEDGGLHSIAFADAPHHAWLIQIGNKNATKKMMHELQNKGHADKIDVLITRQTDLNSARYAMYNHQGCLCLATQPNKKTEPLIKYAQYNGWNTYTLPPTFTIPNIPSVPAQLRPQIIIITSPQNAQNALNGL